MARPSSESRSGRPDSARRRQRMRLLCRGRGAIVNRAGSCAVPSGACRPRRRMLCPGHDRRPPHRRDRPARAGDRAASNAGFRAVARHAGGRRSPTRRARRLKERHAALRARTSAAVERLSQLLDTARRGLSMATIDLTIAGRRHELACRDGEEAHLRADRRDGRRQGDRCGARDGRDERGAADAVRRADAGRRARRSARRAGRSRPPRRRPRHPRRPNRTRRPPR